MSDAAQSPENSAPLTDKPQINGGDEFHVDKPQFNGGAAFTLQLLHLADGEAGLLAAQTAPNLAALVDAFDDDYTNTLILAGGDNFLPSPFLNAGTDPSLNAVIGRTGFARPDIAIHNAIGVEASAIGNHEFDLGSNVFADAIRPDGAWSGALFPHVSANLLFSGDSALNARFTNTLDGGATTLLPEANTLNGRIVPAAVITEGGERIGIVGATTQIIESISSPSGTEVAGFPTGPGPNGEVDNMALLAAQLQPVIDEMIAEGINKIVLLSHLQQIANEQQLATLLRGVDIILAAGSNTRLGDANDTAVAFPGHSASFQGTYPIQTTGADGRPVVIVNTDNEYTYLGRLVVDFDANGEIITNSLTANTAINGAYASTAENVAAAWGTTVENLATTAFADGTRGDRVRDITTAVQSVISSKDGNVFGFTNVYLEGERGFVRSQETNLGNLTADANGHAGREALGEAGASAFVVSLKNGGGIRAQIGSISSAGGASDKLPPIANPDAGKPAGGVSELDIENSLRFDNKLMMFDTTAAGLKAILEHGVAAWPNQGRFPQLGGVRFSWDPDSPPGSRISSIALINDDDQVVARLYDDGAFLPGAPETISVVVLNFLAQGGDGYPIKANGENFRYLLTDGTLSAAVDEALDFTAAANVPANVLGEQQALEEFLQAFHATQETAYNEADTGAALDMRIQNLNFRNDAVFQGDRIDGTTDSEALEGTAGDDTVNGGGGSDTLVGGEGVDTANFAGASAGMNIDLEGGSAQTVLNNGQLTTERAMIMGENGFNVTPLLTNWRNGGRHKRRAQFRNCWRLHANRHS